MDSIDTLHLLADLGSEHCQLNHGPGINTEHIAAADYLVLPIGYKENSVQEVAVRELVIPVCLECAQALQGEEWTLLYCLDCGASRWVSRQHAKHQYRHHVLWLKGCPDCSNQFGGLFFNDAPTLEHIRQCGTRTGDAILVLEESARFMD